MRETLIALVLASATSAVLLWAGPPGIDLAAHIYQRALFLKHGFILWNNFWYAGRYSYITYSILYYPMSAVIGIRLLALLSVATAAVAFAVVVGREWGVATRWSSRAFALLWAATVVSGAYPFALGFAFALVALCAVQAHKRALFALFVLLSLAASPLAFLFLGVVLLGVVIARRPSREVLLVPALIVGAAAVVELVLKRLFPGAGRFPFHFIQLIPAVVFCGLGALMTRVHGRARPLLGLFLAYLVACVTVFAVPADLGSNIERLRYLAIPLALLAAAIVGWRPLAFALPLITVAAVWNVQPLVASYQYADSAAPYAKRSYWRPAISFLNTRLTPSYRVEVVDTIEHWPAVYFPEAGVPLVRGWYRQNDFPKNALLYDDEVGPVAYRSWLRSLGVRYVVLSDAPPDYSARAEARLLRSGRSELKPVFRARHVTIYEVPAATPVVTGDAPASLVAMKETRLVISVTAAGTYRVAVRYSPYWHPSRGCVAPTADGMTKLSETSAGTVDLNFGVNMSRGLETLAGQAPKLLCH